jgi:hypothetical protein
MLIPISTSSKHLTLMPRNTFRQVRNHDTSLFPPWLFMEDPKPARNHTSFQSKFLFVSPLTCISMMRVLIASETPVVAETSYGCQKQIVELYTYDYGRKGFLETRSVRLPTVAIRSGAVRPLRSIFHSSAHDSSYVAILRGVILHLWPDSGAAPGPRISLPDCRRRL